MWNRDEWLGKYEALRGPMWRLFAAAVVLWKFFVQIHGLPVGRMVFTGMVAAAFLVPLYRYPTSRRGTRRGWVLPFASLCAAAAGAYLNWVLVPPRDPWTQLFLAVGLAGGMDFPVTFALAAVLLVMGVAFLVDLQSGRLLPDLGLRILAMAGIFAAFSLARLRRESRLREQRYLRELEAAHLRLHDAHAELQAAAERTVTLAAVEERNRIARELHEFWGIP
ncbi:MAG TPA: hypothetical protein VMW83_06675 [Spirochaetia bacterium]|nr:hypothetical protein [Spirochaetia bacterium]